MVREIKKYTAEPGGEEFDTRDEALEQEVYNRLVTAFGRALKDTSQGDMHNFMTTMSRAIIARNPVLVSYLTELLEEHRL